MVNALELKNKSNNASNFKLEMDKTYNMVFNLKSDIKEVIPKSDSSKLYYSIPLNINGEDTTILKNKTFIDKLLQETENYCVLNSLDINNVTNIYFSFKQYKTDGVDNVGNPKEVYMIEFKVRKVDVIATTSMEVETLNIDDDLN